ncbi:MAG TPA: glycosyltransferase family 39 protein [Herpetosiphonaceae bacterium]|nr:glycosyltransferase family 39 protein [Herpetosiphonaceae bacterium]
MTTEPIPQASRRGFVRWLSLERLPWIALVGLGLLLMVQRHLERQELSATLLIGLFVALGLIGLALDKQPPIADAMGDLQPVPLGYLPLRAGMTLGAAGLAAVSWNSITENAFTLLTVTTWLGALALWLAAWWPWRRPQRAAATPEERRRTLAVLLLLAAITAFGGWLRFHRLYLMPYDMTQDHSWKLLDVQTVLDGKWPIFLPNNTGREPGQFYYIAALIKILGIPRDFMALKTGNAIIGTVTIPLIYLFGRELGGRKLGLFAAALYAVGKWPISTTRMGLRFPYATLPAALILFFLWRYVRLGRRSDALLAGLWMGIGLYGYIGIRAVPFVIVAVFVLLLFDWRRRTTRGILTAVGHGMLVLVTAAAVFLPLGHFMLQFPDQFWYRVATRASDREVSIEQSVCSDPNAPFMGAGENATLCKVGVFAYNNLQMALAFNWRGDRNEVNHVSFTPLLDYVTAALLLAALPILVWRLFVQRSLRWWMALIALPLLLMSSTLSIAFPIENPSTSRTGVAMPVLFVFAAVPLALLSEWVLGRGGFGAWLKRPIWRWGLLGLVCAALFGVAARENYKSYFYDLDRQYRQFVPNTNDIAQAIQAYADRGINKDNAYFVGPGWFEPRALSVLMGDLYWHETHEAWQDQPFPPLVPGQPRLYVINKDNEQRRLELQQQFPTGELKFVKTPVEPKSFYIFYIPAS